MGFCRVVVGFFGGINAAELTYKIMGLACRALHKVTILNFSLATDSATSRFTH